VGNSSIILYEAAGLTGNAAYRRCHTMPGAITGI